jgi:hypothetical protein
MSNNLDEKVTIKNLCEWELAFSRIESPGSVTIPARGINRLPRSEIQAQVFSGNIMFTGNDGKGSHARIYIDDKDTRVLIGFEEEGSKEEQNVLTPDKVKKILEYKTIDTFKKHVEKEVIHAGEKAMLFEEAKRQKLNDYEKIKFIEEYTGFKFDVKTPK